MTFSSLVSVLTLAIISRDVNCTNNLDIEFLQDFMKNEIYKSTAIHAFVCWNTEDTYEFISRMSQNNIYTSINMNVYNIEHYSPTENMLYFIDLNCENSAEVLLKASEKQLFTSPYKWLILTNNEDYLKVNQFAKYNFSVDSNIIFTHKNDNGEYKLYQIYKYYQMSKKIEIEFTNSWNQNIGFKSNELKKLRNNLNGLTLKSSIVVLNNDTFNHLTDYRAKHIDTVSKVNYILTNHLIDFVNGTREFQFVNTWGYLNKENNLYTGMIGSLQTNDAEIGGTPLFMTSDRIPIIDYVPLATPTRGFFIFRSPPLSYVTNVFTLPFSGDVWISSLGLCLFASILLYISVSVEWRQYSQEDKTNTLLPSFMDSVMITIGAVAQQGASNEPRSGAGRTVMILTFIALMFLYVSYSANIVALLQSSATNIRTLEDLLQSRLKLGVHDIVYNHYYFETATEPTRKAIYERKVAPKGQKPNFMNIETGVSQVREGFFAFHGESSSIYKLIGDTFYESEKCGIQEISYLQVVDPYFAIKKNSSYKELFKVGLRKIHETGIQSRELQRLYTKKPECHTSGGNFVSVGLIDAYPAFLVLGVGMGLSLMLFVLEEIVARRIKRYF